MRDKKRSPEAKRKAQKRRKARRVAESRKSLSFLLEDREVKRANS